ncbi:MAG TPA: SDR family oxidoreductase [Tepidiformaceae bacterium]|nr:SDR family oxidoreductase [Tepidiformaceae bacterium]
MARTKVELGRLKGKVALVTGASRGVGARTAVLLGEAKAHVVINYRDKVKRAEEVAEEVRRLGAKAMTVKADITSAEETQLMFAAIKAAFGRLDILVLNASGGLERDADPGYAMRLNRDAQVRLLEESLPLIPEGGRVVFVTSHLAHFHGEKPVPGVYEHVAVSKKAGELALRERLPALAERAVTMVVVSGDLIEGTTTPKLMDRKMPGLIEYRREQAGWLPTIDDFAQAIVEAAADELLAHGETVYVGSTE